MIDPIPPLPPAPPDPGPYRSDPVTALRSQVEYLKCQVEALEADAAANLEALWDNMIYRLRALVLVILGCALGAYIVTYKHLMSPQPHKVSFLQVQVETPPKQLHCEPPQRLMSETP